MNCGECGRSCAGATVDVPMCSNGVCTSTCALGFFNVSTPIAPDPDDGCESHERRVFLTSQNVLADFIGAPNADAKCQMLGESALGAGTTWVAWLSDAATSPAMRFNRSLVAYKLVDGTIIANDWTDLTDGMLTNPITKDELGNTLPNNEVWTATDPQGNWAGAADCQGWTVQGTGMAGGPVGQVGHSDSTAGAWTNVFTQFCNRDNVKLYCFEQ